MEELETYKINFVRCDTIHCLTVTKLLSSMEIKAIDYDSAQMLADAIASTMPKGISADVVWVE